MGRIYYVETNGVTLDEIRDFWEILAASDSCLQIHGFGLGNTSEVGDAMEESLLVQSIRGEGSVTSGSGGSTPTARPKEKGDTAFGGTVEANNTTRAVVGSGALVVLESFAWNIRIPFEKIWTPETRPIISPSDRWILALPNDVADPITFHSWAEFEEIGG